LSLLSSFLPTIGHFYIPVLWRNGANIHPVMLLHCQ
jgi:hypothetical protein